MSMRKASDEYRLLKNRMKGEFRAIRSCLEDGELPDAPLVHDFLKHSRQMTSYTGAEYGAADYPAYLAGCEALGRACAAGDNAAAREAFARVSACKKSCHHQWKP